MRRIIVILSVFLAGSLVAWTPEAFLNHHDYPAYNTSRTPPPEGVHMESLEHSLQRNFSWPMAGRIEGIPNVPFQVGRVEILAADRIVIDIFWGCIIVDGLPEALWTRDQEVVLHRVLAPQPGEVGYDEAIFELERLLFETDGTPKRILLHQHSEISMDTWAFWVTNLPSDSLWRSVTTLYASRSPYVEVEVYP